MGSACRWEHLERPLGSLLEAALLTWWGDGSMSRLEDLVGLVAELERRGIDVDLIARTSPVLLAEIEENLGIVFPESLRQFWETYDYLAIGGDEFTTLDELSEYLERAKAHRPRIPPNYIHVLSDGCGGHYFVIAAVRGKPRPDDFGSVVFCPSGASGSLDTDSSDFLEFVISIARKRL